MWIGMLKILNKIIISPLIVNRSCMFPESTTQLHDNQLDFPIKDGVTATKPQPWFFIKALWRRGHSICRLQDTLSGGVFRRTSALGTGGLPDPTAPSYGITPTRCARRGDPWHQPGRARSAGTGQPEIELDNGGHILIDIGVLIGRSVTKQAFVDVNILALVEYGLVGDVNIFHGGFYRLAS
jgi:hypothetical protein